MRSRGVWAVVALLLVSCGFLSAERPAVRTSSGKVRKAKRTQPPKKHEVHAFAAESPGLQVECAVTKGSDGEAAGHFEESTRAPGSEEGRGRRC